MLPSVPGSRCRLPLRNERGGEGYCVKGGGEEEGERERERAGRVRHESSSAKKFGLGKPVVHLELVKFLGL